MREIEGNYSKNEHNVMLEDFGLAFLYSINLGRVKVIMRYVSASFRAAELELGLGMQFKHACCM